MIVTDLRGPRADASGPPHVVLLGDSVFDNGAYVGSGPDLVSQVRAALSQHSAATLNARDGAVIADVSAQLSRLPPEASHLIISVGGNDALTQSGVLDEQANSVAGALEKLAGVREAFHAAYATMLDRATLPQLPTAVCTIYEPRYPERERRRLAATALMLLNDAITREAFSRGLTLIDLRLICNRDDDFANPIEPSHRGGAKIADAIARFVRGEAQSNVVSASGG
jgi:hypothetical protein